MKKNNSKKDLINQQSVVKKNQTSNSVYKKPVKDTSKTKSAIKAQKFFNYPIS